MNDILNIPSKNSYLTTKQWEEVVEYVKNRKKVVEDDATEEPNDEFNNIVETPNLAGDYDLSITVPTMASDMAPSSQQETLFEKLMAADTVTGMYNLLMETMFADKTQAEALTTEQINDLFARLDVLDPNGDESDTEMIVDVLIELPNYVSVAEEEGEICSVFMPDTQGTTNISTNTTWELNGNTSLTGTITIQQGGTLTITGTGTIYRAPSFKNQLFKLTGNGQLIIKGIDGAITIDGAAEFTKADSPDICPTSTGIQANATGHLVYLNGSEAVVEMENVVLQNNWLVASDPEKRSNGSAILLTSGKSVTMKNCTIQNMYSTYGGSAIMVGCKTPSAVNLEGCTIKNCVVWYDHSAVGKYNDGNDGGGAFRTNGGTACSLTVSNSILEGNMSSGMAGAIYFNSGDGSATLKDNVQIIGNQAATYGGGIMIMTQINLNSVTIKDNIALYGGGVAYRPFNTGSTAYLKPNSNELLDNIQNGSMNLNSNIHITNNKATESGGGLYIEVGVVRCNTQSTPQNWGIYGTTMNLSIDGATLTENKAQNGGAVFMTVKKYSDTSKEAEKLKEVTASLSFNSGILKKNEASNGGGVYLKGIPVTIGTVEGTTIIEENIATYGSGGAFYIDSTERLLEQELEVTVKKATVTKNMATSGSGGAIYITGIEGDAKTTILSDSTINNNSAMYGGATYVSGGSLKLENSTVNDNSTTGDGGAAYISGGSFTMTGGEIKTNTAANGGAIYITNGQFDMYDGAATGNTAENGGVAYIDGGNVTIDGGTIDNNCTNINGGAFCVISGDFNLLKGTISNNVALNNGGAIAVTNGNVVIGTKECHDAGEYSTHIHPILENNIALEGGGLFINGGTTIMYCGKIRNNHTYEKTVNVYVANGDFKYNGGQIGINYDTGVFINGGEFKDESNEGKVKHELHYKNSLSGDIYNYKIPPSKWMASPKGDILSIVETDSTSPTWKDKFPEYEFVGWEDGGLINDKVYMLIANFEKK